MHPSGEFAVDTRGCHNVSKRMGEALSYGRGDSQALSLSSLPNGKELGTVLERPRPPRGHGSVPRPRHVLLCRDQGEGCSVTRV